VKSARILIVSGAALSRNPRVLKEAGTLAEAGHDVTVLTLRNHAAAERFDRQILATARFKRIVVDVAAVAGASPGRVFLRRLKAAGARWAARQLGRESIETIGPAGELLAMARRHPADLVIGHTEIGLWVAARLLAEGRRVAADIEDWHSEDLPPEERAGRPVRLLRNIENQLLREAAYTITVCDGLADALQQAGRGARPVVISNSFPLQPNPRHGPPGEPPAFLWFSQTLGPGRGLEGFIEAWNRMTLPSRVMLLGEDRGGYRDALRALVPAPRRTLLEFADLVPPGELPALIARHDIGLALEVPASRNRDFAVTNKLLQYLNAGLAVVATSTAGQREVLGRAPEAGVFLDPNPAISAATLDRLVRDQAELRARQLAARRLAETHYSWERESRVLLELVNRTLSA
jgi:glycosyltransferase involved in cell wall biosynthesis